MKPARRRLACRLVPVLASWPGAASAAPAPATFPTADVEIEYAIAGVADTQRLRVQASTRLQRVDAPGGHMSVITDPRAGRMIVLDHDRRTATVLPVPPARKPDPGALVRGGVDTIAGLACTDWKGPGPDAATTCLTADGDTLRIDSDGQTLVEAVHLTRATQPDRWFTVPAGYRTAPPAPVSPGREPAGAR